MNYVGVDVHKKYSVLCALDESGRKLREGRVEGNSATGFAQFRRARQEQKSLGAGKVWFDTSPLRWHNRRRAN